MRTTQLQIRTRQGVRRLEYRTQNGSHQGIGPAIPQHLTDECLRQILLELRAEFPAGTPDRKARITRRWAASLGEVTA